MGALEHWSDYNVAIVGAAGALAGLLIVALSVNIAQVVSSRQLIARAASSIAGLLLAVVACAIGLIPGQPALAYGVEIVIAAVIAGAFGVHAIGPIMAADNGAPNLAARLLKIAVGLLPAALAAAGGITVLVGGIDAGLALVAASALVAIVGSVFLAWVALVEVLR